MTTRMACRLVLALVLVALLACNATEDTPRDAATDQPGKSDVGATAQVVGSAGGTLLFHGGKVRLEVPPGALTKECKVKVLVEKTFPKDEALVPNTVYDLLPDGTKFAKAVKLSIVYEQARVPSGVNEADLRIHKVESGAWKELKGGVDAKAHVAWAQLNGFSKYGIKGPKPASVDGGADSTALVDAGNPDAPELDQTAPDATGPDANVKPDMSTDFLTQCVGQPKGSTCDDGNHCTKGDVCDGTGGCQGTPYICKPAFQCETSRICDGKGGCLIAYKLKGAICDDKVACTKMDACDGKGVCQGVPYTCKPGQCDSNSTCDGKGGCTVTPKAQGGACDDNNYCTELDVCDGKGGCKGTAYTCKPGQCDSTSNCDGKGGCITSYKGSGTTCDDGNPCTKGDACDGKGGCTGTPYTCTPGQCEVGACDGKGGCTAVSKAKGMTCDDKSLCTKNDACDGKGVCSGTSYTCSPPGQCHSSTCDGKGGCVVSSKTAGLACDDKNLCTKADACDGKGGCTGTPYTCTPGQCEVSSACDGKGGCTAVSKAKGTTCDDKKLCTKGDACDGKGACSGTSYTCTPPGQCHNSICDGKGGCTVSLKTAGSACDDKNVCTKDACDGKGGCKGTSYTPKSFSKCGGGCTSGYHVASMKCNQSCGYCDPYSYYSENSVTCAPNCGGGFIQCGASPYCPSGYYPGGLLCKKGCGRCKDGMYPNSVSCNKVSGKSSFQQCGTKCPTGYYTASTSCNSSCNSWLGGCVGGNNFALCKKKP